MSKTKKKKKKKAHHTYGKVICKVLGSDIDRLPFSPVVVAQGQGGSGQSSAKICEVQAEDHNDENCAAVETTGEAVYNSQIQVEREDIHNGPGWHASKPTNRPVSQPATGLERDQLEGVRIQLKGVDSCATLFRLRDNGEDEDGMEEDGDDEQEVVFFESLFEDGEELRGFYERNCENGEFYCLVCGVTGDMPGRRYKSCKALVQHSVSISNTKKKKAHRAYGKVVCKVLGWEINMLPSLPVVAHGQDGSGQSSAKTCDVQGEVENCVDESPADVATTREAEKKSQSQVETEDVHDSVVKDNSNSIRGIGCHSTDS